MVRSTHVRLTTLAALAVLGFIVAPIAAYMQVGTVSGVGVLMLSDDVSEFFRQGGEQCRPR
jgi:hypothetical protein